MALGILETPTHSLNEIKMKPFRWNHSTFGKIIAPKADKHYIALVRELLYDLDVSRTDMKDGPWLAGGTLRRLFEGQLYLGSDFDFFFKSEEQKNEMQATLLRHFEPEEIFSSKNAVTYRILYGSKIIIVQLIHLKYYDMPSDVIKDFDIVACQLITNGHGLVFGATTINQIENRVLRINRSVLDKKSFSAVHTLRRMIKMGEDGYRMGQYFVAEYLNYVRDHPEVIRMDTSMSPEHDSNGNLIVKKTDACLDQLF